MSAPTEQRAAPGSDTHPDVRPDPDGRTGAGSDDALREDDPAGSDAGHDDDSVRSTRGADDETDADGEGAELRRGDRADDGAADDGGDEPAAEGSADSAEDSTEPAVDDPAVDDPAVEAPAADDNTDDGSTADDAAGDDAAGDDAAGDDAAGDDPAVDAEYGDDTAAEPGPAEPDDDPGHAATLQIDPSHGSPSAERDEDDPVDRLEVVGPDPRTDGTDVVQDAHGASPGQLRVDFGAHLEANYQRLVAQLYAITLEPGEAHDVVQDAYSRAWREWDEISRTPDPSAWIRRVAVRSTIRSWRRVLARFGNGRPVAIGDGVDERTAALLAALGRLQPAERRAVVLFHMAGSSLSEIAAVERVRPATVRARLSRARHVVAEGMADVLPAVPGTESAPRPPAGYPDGYISGYLYTSNPDGTSP